MINHNSHHSQRWERGQSLVETALGFLFVLVILLGMLDLGRMYYINVALEDAAGEAALYLALYPGCDIAHVTKPQCADPNNALYRALHASNEDLDQDRLTITIIPPQFEGTDIYYIGGTVTVRVEYEFRLLTPIINEIVGSNLLTLTGEASQTIIGQPIP